MKRLLPLVATALFCLVLSRAAEAVNIPLRICDDAACAGGNDIFSTNSYRSPSNTMVLPGWSSISVSAINTVAGFDLVYDVFSVGPDPKALWVYASAIDFTFPGVGILSDGGFFSLPGATLFGGSSNLLFDMSNQLGDSVPSPTHSWSGYEHAWDGVNPYSVTISLLLSHPGSAPGRTQRTVGTVELIPEPASLLLMGGGIVAAMRNRRRASSLRSERLGRLNP